MTPRAYLFSWSLVPGPRSFWTDHESIRVDETSVPRGVPPCEGLRCCVRTSRMPSFWPRVGIAACVSLEPRVVPPQTLRLRLVGVDQVGWDARLAVQAGTVLRALR